MPRSHHHAASLANLNRLGSGTSGLPPGQHFNLKGYPRYSTGALRNKYVHRVVMANAAAEFCVYPLNPSTGLPDGFHVEHVDHNRTHSCLGNLLLLEACIHNACSWKSWRPKGEVDWQTVCGIANGRNDRNGSAANGSGADRSETGMVDGGMVDDVPF